jgi:hypothetical protein
LTFRLAGRRPHVEPSTGRGVEEASVVLLDLRRGPWTETKVID